MDRQQAEVQLKRFFGFEHFHDLQWEVIEKLFAKRRVLFVVRTGYGKSLCYQFPATQMTGVTIVFSPLIALMRNQVDSMIAKGIQAAAINSNQTSEENTKIINQAQKNMLDILYIAPERMENVEWIRATTTMKIAMVVVDEAHCISLWGQNFRPNYRRIVNLLHYMPRNFPVLATTATATSRVQEDIIEQIGSDLTLVRGKLMRPNIRLLVVRVRSEDEKFIWLAEYFPRIKKTGIIYTGTQANTDIYSNWIQFLGYRSAAYSGRIDADTRKRIESDFIGNKYDCVVSTNALGMGIDKPDIRYIIHTQIPQSPIHYYQEIGRAGRDGGDAVAVLLYNPDEDDKLPKAFIEKSRPSIKKYEKVMEVIRKELLGRNEIIQKANLTQTEVVVIIADLIDQGIINEQMVGKSKKYAYNPDAPELETDQFELLRDIQILELNEMLEYADITSCRMRYLCNYLGDEDLGSCGTCDNDSSRQMRVTIAESAKQKLQEFRETYFPVLEVETMRSNIVNGVAASYYGISNVGEAIHHCKYGKGGDFPDWLLRLTLKAFRVHYGKSQFDLLLYVPPTESGTLVKNFAEKISRTIGIPISHGMYITTSSSPQKIFQSGISKKENVRGKFAYRDPDEIKGKKILLIDDVFDSGHTVKEIGRYLTSVGAVTIAPLVIAKTVGGDN